MASDITLNKTIKLISYGHHLKSGHYQIHSRFTHVLNFHRNDHLVTLTHQPGKTGPVSIIIEGIDLNTIHSLHIHEKSIKINQEEIRLEPENRYDSDLKIQKWDHDRIQGNLINTMESFLSMAPEMSLAFIFDPKRFLSFQGAFELGFVKQVQEGIHLIQSGNLLEGSSRIKGLGFGLTPGGDDFIAGFLFGLFILQILYRKELSALRLAIARMAMGSNLISNTYIHLAHRGWFYQSLKMFVQALATATAIECSRKMKTLLSLGSTSGADLLTGLFFALIEKNKIRLWSQS